MFCLRTLRELKLLIYMSEEGVSENVWRLYLGCVDTSNNIVQRSSASLISLNHRALKLSRRFIVEFVGEAFHAHISYTPL